MDPFTHTFTGGLLASSGLKKVVPMATAALLIGANLPDIDIFVSLMGDQASIAHRRGWTHGVLAWAVLPVLLTAGLLAYSKFKKTSVSISPWALLGISLIAILSHPLLDWLNNYGVRLLMPFDERWFYGDTLFVVDPWMWLMLGGAYYLITSHTKILHGLWLVFWLGSTAAVLLNQFSSMVTYVIWGIGLLAVLFARLTINQHYHERLAQSALILALFYTVANGVASQRADAQVLNAMQKQLSEPILDVMVAPMPTDPTRGSVVIELEDSYRVGYWHWLSDSRLTLLPDPIAKNLDEPIVVQAKQALNAERFLTWSRFPFAIIQKTDNGYRVNFEDARYAMEAGLIRGPEVILSDAR
jgi:inner membrane protein